MTLEEQKVEALVRAATERGWTVERGGKIPRRPWQSHWIVRGRGAALYGDPDALIRRLAREYENGSSPHEKREEGQSWTNE
jgi:hypothetical protein